MMRRFSKENRIAHWQRDARHMLKTMEKIERFKAQRHETDPEIYQDALYRNLHTISESADYIPQEIKNEYPQVSWYEVKGFRNILVHNYLGDDIDTRIVESVVYQDLPVLHEAVRDMLARYPETNKYLIDNKNF